ncbi:MAG: response regulator [Cyclobacteriaceae bacterium]
MNNISTFYNYQRSFRVILLVCFALISSTGLEGQNRFSKFRHISTSDGFALNSVNSFAQDEQGMMWFGTRNGLIRYDGVNLKVMRRESGAVERLGVNDIYTIHLDGSKGVWIGSRYGLSFYHNKSSQTEDLEWFQSATSTSTLRRVFDILRINKDQVLIGGGSGVEVYNESTKKLVVNRFDPNDPTSINSNRIVSFYQSKIDSTIWVGTRSGLNQVVSNKDGKLTFKRIELDPVDQSNFHIQAISEDRLGNVWVGTSTGLFIRQSEEETFRPFESISNDQLTNPNVRCLTIDGENRLWVGTFDGLNIIDSEFKLVQGIRHNPQNPDGLKGNNIRALFTDKNGGVWVGTYYGGVHYWSGNLVSFEKIDERSGTQLGYNVVNSIVEDERGNIYFGSEGNGITTYNIENGDFRSISQLISNESLGSIKVKEVLYEGNGKFWIGTFDNGVVELNLTKKDLKEYNTTNSGISSNRVVSLASTADGNLWIGNLSSGLDLFETNNNRFTRFTATSGSSAITYNNVRSLLVTKSGDLYVGSGAGLSVLSAKSYKNREFVFESFQLENGEVDNLAYHDIVEDNNGKIWLATLSSGLLYVEEGKLILSGLSDISSVFAIEEGEEGVLWLSTEKGIVRFDPVTLERKVFNRKDGLHANEFNRGASLKASDGKIYFGGALGVSAFHPETLDITNNQAPKVVLTKFVLGEEELQPNDDTEILAEPIEYTSSLTLDYDQNIFSVHFAMPNFVKSDKNTYSYRLIGLNDNWVNTSNPFVSFTIQRGGNYVFEVKGINSDGLESTEITSLEIEVKDAPWLTIWAFMIYIILFMSALLVFIFFFKSRINLQHQLEAETREFLHQQEINKQKLQFFTNISHEFRTPLTLISGPLEKLISEYKGPSYVFRQLLVIKKNTDQLFKLINELMDFRKLENKQMSLQAAEGNIVLFAKEIFLSFDQHAKLNKLDYSFHSDQPEIKVFFDRDKLEKTLYNLISNAFKYTEAKGKITVNITRAKKKVSISVKDNGMGISPDHLEKIFDRFYEIPKSKSQSKYKQGSGIGLAIAKNIVELHKGELTATSTEGEGSDFVMTLRLGQDHLMPDEIISTFKNSEDVSQYVLDKDVLAVEESATVEWEGEEFNENAPKVLIVEDNVGISSFMKDVMRKEYSVTVAENGALGYKEALSSLPDLIISDVMMPVMDGIELCSKIKTDIRTSHIPFILLTARTSLIYKYDGLESGADEYLSKPFEIKELLLKCRNILSTQEKLKARFAEVGEVPTSEAPVDSIDEVMMNKAIHIIRENIGNEFFGIQMLCDQLGMSRSLLFTKFKVWTNQTPNDYILTARMKKAASLIEQNKVNISQIGYMVGFKSANYFSKSFKKHFSISPKAYAQKFAESLGMD